MNAASFENLVSWLVQVSALAFAGALLPMVLRIRHPKSQLAYYHSVLLVCFVLPLIQPWQHALLLVTHSSTNMAQPLSSATSWPALIMTIVVIGIAVKLCWLLVGLWQLRRYRRSALPLYPLPQSIKDAKTQTGADALFCLSKDVAGPATLGYIDPVVLLPVWFMSLDEAAQRSVACHELLHVRRRDWVITVLEEIAGSLFWFNPAMRWLLAQTKLTREQLVDAEVVRMTATAPYIQALLSMAVITKGRRMIPAAPFFTEGHLVHRMRSLLTNPSRSWIRLGGSYLTAALFLAAAGWGLTMWFPLMGEAQIVRQPAPPAPFVIFLERENPHIVSPRTNELFNIRVTAPVGPSHPSPGPSGRPLPWGEGSVYFLANPQGNSDAKPEQDVLFVAPPLPPPPPPPPPLHGDGGFGLGASRGVRVIRPGDRPSPEQIEDFIQTFPDKSVVEITQGADGTVQRISVRARRSADEATIPNFGFLGVVGGPGPASTPVPTEPTSAADGLH